MIITQLSTNNKIRRGIKESIDKTKKEIRKSLYDIGKDLYGDAVKAIKEPKHGKYYKTMSGRGKWVGKYPEYEFVEKRLKRLKGYTASAPGEAPAIVSGKLIGSISFNIIGSDKLIFASYGVDYAPFLEYKNLKNFSGKGSKNIDPRPYLSRAYKQNQTKIIAKLRDAAIKGTK